MIRPLYYLPFKRQLTRIEATVMALVFLLPGDAFAQAIPNRYAVFLRDQPVAARFSSRAEIQSAAGNSYRQQIEAAQRAVRDELFARNIRITGSVSTLLNAIFVVAPEGRVAELAAIQGVAGVVPLHRRRMLLNRATALVNGPQAWALSGGLANAGKGIKIGILDTGIDQEHPAMQDASLPIPPGYPICNPADCAFTNSKVIVARSYIRELAAGSDPANPAADSKPDDYSPRDHVGHGTATASSAAGNTAAGVVTINGMAPKAYLGNYRIFGSPEVNDGSTDDILVLALEDAVNDGMDVISLSVGGPAFVGPLDTGAACGLAAGLPCDVSAAAYEAAAQKVVIVVAAGNSGEDGNNYPTLNSISSPADAPGVITAGATTNSHYFGGAVEVSGAGVPASLNFIASQSSDSFAPFGAVTAPLVDITQLGNDGLACSGLPAGSLTGAFALIERGICDFSVKMGNAVQAGAAGVVFYMADTSATIAPGGLTDFSQPAVMVANSDGLNLKTFIDANPGYVVTIEPSGIEESATGNLLASFSSMGPAIGTFGMKPDLLAPGTFMYMAAQSYDPLGVMYSANGFVVADGTSFATPLIAGAAALVKQNHPNYTAQQIKSALVNTATQDVLKDNSGSAVNVLQTGPGKLAVDQAILTNVAVIPQSLSFGPISAGTLPLSKRLQVTNTATAAVNLSVAISATTQGSGSTLAVDRQILALQPGQAGSINVTLTGSAPPPGVYSGAITISGAGVPLRVPYMYLVGSGVAANLTVLSGDGNVGTAGQPLPDGVMAFKLTDAQGVPVSGASVTFATRSAVTLSQISSVTNSYGIGSARVTLGPRPGSYSVTARAGGLSYTFTGGARAVPAITPAGVVDAASYGTRIAPGSYITIFGSALSDLTGRENTARLPLAVDLTQVSFDVPAAHLSVPGRIVFVSPGQIVLQVPWELQGQSSAQVKVTIDYSFGNVVTIPISDYAPALFEQAGIAAATDPGGNVISGANPAVRGQTISLYANGLGPVNNGPATGDPAPASPAATTTSSPVVTIGGQTAPVQFSGLTPGLPGLYQINATVPANIAAGNQQVILSIGNQSAKTSILPVR